MGQPLSVASAPLLRLRTAVSCAQIRI